MMLHPMSIAELIIEALSLIILIRASLRAIQIIDKWQPSSSTQVQLSLERQGELLSFEGRIVSALSVFALILLTINITGIMPRHIQGAMCGTGVVRASNGYAERAFALKLITIIALYIWHEIDVLNRTDKRAPMSVYAARFYLLAVPFSILGGAAIVKTLVSLDNSAVVNCCAALYDRVSSQPQTPVISHPQTGELLLFSTSAALYLASGLCCIFRPGFPRQKIIFPLVFFLSGALFVPVALRSLLHTFAPYHYQVLHHHCPYCLFLPKHNLVGYLLCGSLLYGFLESLAPLIARVAGNRFPELESFAQKRIRAAGLRAVAMALVFLVLSTVPAIVWKWRHGVWMIGP